MSRKKSVTFTEKSQLLEPPHIQTNTNFTSFCCDLLKCCFFPEYDSDDATEQIYTSSDSEDDIPDTKRDEPQVVKQVNFSEYEMDVTRYKWKPLLSYTSFSKKYNTPPAGSVPLWN